MAADHGGDAPVTNYKPAPFQCRTVVANATAADQLCETPAHQHVMDAAWDGQPKAMAMCPLRCWITGQQAAAGQPARLRLDALRHVAKLDNLYCFGLGILNLTFNSFKSVPFKLR